LLGSGGLYGGREDICLEKSFFEKYEEYSKKLAGWKKASILAGGRVF